MNSTLFLAFTVVEKELCLNRMGIWNLGKTTVKGKLIPNPKLRLPESSLPVQ